MERLCHHQPSWFHFGPLRTLESETTRGTWLRTRVEAATGASAGRRGLGWAPRASIASPAFGGGKGQGFWDF